MLPRHASVAFALVVGGLAVTAPTARAQSNLTVYGTGVAADGTTLSNGSPDPHYTAYNWATLGSLGTPLGQAYTLNNGYQPSGSGPYAYSSTSRYIWNDASGDLGNNPSHNTAFRTTFDLTGFDLSSVALTGQMAADNHVYGVFLNGVRVGSLGTDTFSNFTPFTISSGFVTGLNSLDFYATDDGPPGGFDTDLSGSGSPAVAASAVPEPSTWALLGGGLVALAGVTRRRRARTA